MPYPHFPYAKQQSFYLAKPLRVQIISICITTITKKPPKLSIANKSRCLNTFLDSCSIWENKKIKQISDYFARINSLIHCWQQLAQMPTEESLINRKRYLSLEKQNSNSVGSSEVKKVSSCFCSMKDWLSYKVHVQLSYSNLNNIKERGFQYSVLSLIITESCVQVWVY